MGNKELFIIGAGVAAVAVAALLIYRKNNPDAFDPTSADNLAYSGVNKIGAALTGDPHFSLGAWLWEKTHSEVDPTAPVTLPGEARDQSGGAGTITTWDPTGSQISPYFAP